MPFPAMTELMKFWYLKQFNLFSELSREEMQMIADMTTMAPFPEKGILFFSGDTPDSVFLLKEGHVKISRLVEDGRKLTLDILNPAEIFGESAITGSAAERGTMAEALTPLSFGSSSSPSEPRRPNSSAARRFSA